MRAVEELFSVKKIALNGRNMGGIARSEGSDCGFDSIIKYTSESIVFLLSSFDTTANPNFYHGLS